MPVHIGNTEAEELFVGNMGVKEVYIGDTLIYQRPGGYFYLTLNTKETD